MHLHRRGGQQQQTVDQLFQLVSEPVRLRDPGLACPLQVPPYPVRLVEDHHVPLGLDDLLRALRARSERQRADHVRPGHPRVPAATAQVL